jgi:hypothetical protein
MGFEVIFDGIAPPLRLLGKILANVLNLRIYNGQGSHGYDSNASRDY